MSARRLPGKPLLKINGKSIIARVFNKAKNCKIGKVIVATEDKIIVNEIKKNGGKPFICRTGHSFIKEMMLDKNAQLGGEMSGHIFFKNRWYGFDDAIYAGARMLEMLSSQDESDSFFRNVRL